MTHRIPRGRTAVVLLSALLGTVSLIPLSSVAFAAGRSEQLRAHTPAPGTGHLPQLLRDVIVRLRLDDGTKAPISQAAAHHGDLRAQQGYTVAMAVEESRLLQVSIFTTLHKSQSHLEFEKVLPAVVVIADEVDAQLKQQMLRFMAADAAKATATAKMASVPKTG